MTRELRRIILETGTGTDLYGEDYTKAAKRAVQDALHHSSLLLFRSMDLSHEDMQVRVTIGVQHPDRVDTDAVAATLPRGKATVTARKGGLNVDHPALGQTNVIATAAVEAWIPVTPGQYRLT